MRNRTALALALALAGCTAPPFTTPPTVTSTIPASDAPNVARNATISATFSETMVATSFGATTFTVSPAAAGSAPIAGTVSVSGTTATLTPQAPLAVGTKYTAKIAAAAQGAAGGPLAADYTWSFTTVPAPTVVSTNPANGAVSVARGTTISATFSEAMVDSSIDGSTFTVSPAKSRAIAGRVSTSGTTATFTPQAQLTPDQAYTAKITTAATGQAGGPLAAPYSWTFTTSAPPAKALRSTSGGGIFRSANFRGHFRLGAPQPMGRAKSQNFDVRLGPVTNP
jgi:methionine-rich copper-binding protein CopC